MAPGKSLNVANLEALGGRRLAELLLEISKGNAAAQRRLRLALAGGSGAEEAARAIAKRLASIGRAKTWLDWQKIKSFVTELDDQHRTILGMVAPSHPREAFDLLWRLVECAEGVFARTDDGSGRLSAVFHTAARDLGPLAQRANIAADDLADRAVRALTADGYGIWDELIPILAPQLGLPGLELVKRAMQAWRAELVPAKPSSKRQVVGWSSAGPLHADEIEASHRRHTASFVLQQVADALGDVDGYIKQFDERARRMPGVAAGIAARLLEAGRKQEALAALDAIDAPRRKTAQPEWEQARADVLEALGRADEAQSFRWERFAATLSADHLRVYLGKLADFDDFEAEQRALAHALTFPDVHQALAFLVAWPDLRRASDLVLGKAPALNGDLYELLSPAAEALEARHPLAATVLRRAMIGFTLEAARSSRYKHAARHLRDCRNESARIEDFGPVPNHPTYEKALQAAHGRKTGFWQEVDVLS